MKDCKFITFPLSTSIYRQNLVVLNLGQHPSLWDHQWHSCSRLLHRFVVGPTFPDKIASNGAVAQTRTFSCNLSCNVSFQLSQTHCRQVASNMVVVSQLYCTTGDVVVATKKREIANKLMYMCVFHSLSSLHFSIFPTFLHTSYEHCVTCYSQVLHICML